MNSIQTSWLIRGFASLVLTISCSGCYWGCGGGSGGSSDPNAGFNVQTIVRANGIDISQNAQVIADFQYATGSTTGSIEHFNVFTATGFKPLPSARVPGVWRFQAFNFTGCPGLIGEEREMKLGQTVTLRCFIQTIFPFNASPSSVDVNSPPATGLITGQGISTTYGMPTVSYFTEAGTLAAEQTATAVGADGTWMQGPVPDFSTAYNGQYTLLILNKNADGSRTIVGTTSITVTGFYIPPPPEPEPDPCDCTGDLPCMICTIN
jgi:hypothetical protein